MTESSHSLWSLFLDRLKTQSATLACTAYDFGDLPQWCELTWRELAERVVRACEEMLQSGIETGDRVATWSENRLEWIIADLAIQGVGGVHVPFHASATLSQVCQLSAHAECRLILVSSRLAEMQPDRLPQESSRDTNSQPTLTTPQLVESRVGKSLRACVANIGLAWIDRLGTRERTDRLLNSHLLNPSSLAQKELVALMSSWVARQPEPDQLTTLLYTSGTTGRPKGVELSQANLMANVRDKLAVLELRPEDVRYALLPFSHIFARTCDLATWLAVGCHLVLASSKEAWFDELPKFSPTYINAVPLFYERCRQRAATQGRLDEPGVLREMLGGRIRLCNCGGAPLSDAVYDWFVAQDVMLVTGYGLTETSPVLTSSAPDAMRRGAVGRALPQVELKLAADGEVLARGPNVMRGYYRDPQATTETFCDGWFLTGDLGVLDAEGYLTLVGRKKELIVTPGGLKVVPTEIENRLLSLPWVAQAWVTADERGRLQAVLVPHPELFAQHVPLLASDLNQSEPDEASPQFCLIEVDGSRLSPTSNSLPGAPTTEELRRLAFEVHEATSDLPRYCRVVRFAIEPRPFTVNDETATPKGSLRRAQIAQRSAPILKAWQESIGAL